MQITLKEYCPRTKYGSHIQDIVRQVTQIEDEYNHKYIRAPLPEFVRTDKFEFTPANIVAFAGNIIKSCLP